MAKYPSQYTGQNFDTSVNRALNQFPQQLAQIGLKLSDLESDTVWNKSQTLSDAQKSQARANIGAVSNEEVAQQISVVNSKIDNIKPINLTNNGTITNLADEEDITSEDNLLKLKDRYNYVILRSNKTFASQVTKADTIYEIRYNFDLADAIISLPAGATLRFNGGSLSNGVIAADAAGNQINCIGTYAIFKDVYLSGMFSGVGYSWMTEASSYEDYLKFSNICHFEKGVIEESFELNIDWWINPFKSRWPSLPDGIEVNSLNIDGRGCRINMLAADDSTQKPFNSTQSDYTWGIDLLCPFIKITQNAYTKGCSVRNLTFIDDKAINGNGSDLTIEKFTYNGHTGYVRGVFISFRTEQHTQPVYAEFGSIVFRSRHGFIYGSGGVSNALEHGEDTIVVTDSEFTSQGTFPFELWKWSTGSYTSPRFMAAEYNGCKFEFLSGLANLLSSPNIFEQKFVGCTFVSDYNLTATELFANAKYKYHGCKFINVTPGATDSANANTEREFVNCTFIEGGTPSEGTNGKFWVYGGAGKLRFMSCDMHHTFYQPAFATHSDAELEMYDSVFEMNRRAGSSFPETICKRIDIRNSRVRNNGIVGGFPGNIFMLYIPRANNRIIDLVNVEKCSEFRNSSRYERTGTTEDVLKYAKDSRVWLPMFDTNIVSGLREDGYLGELSSTYIANLVGGGSLQYEFDKYFTLCIDADVVLVPEAYNSGYSGRFAFNFTIGNYKVTSGLTYSASYKNVLSFTVANNNDNTEYFTFYFPLRAGKHIYAVSISSRFEQGAEYPTIIAYCDGEVIAPRYAGNISKIQLFSGFGENTLSSININSFNNTGVYVREISVKNFVTQVFPETYATQ